MVGDNSSSSCNNNSNNDSYISSSSIGIGSGATGAPLWRLILI